ncbi:MAG TPA: hypothetical protein VFF68_09220, partial [Anaerolineaceae bacterium]|nr:hypothetical protein [Anaerolineaceae bacterium]
YLDRSVPYFREVLARTPGIVTQEDVCAAPGRYFLQNSYANILELFDLPARGAKYFHLYGIPLVEGGRDYANMQKVLGLVGAEHAAYANLYCFNHAYPNNVLYMAEKIAAKNLIAVHSSAPEKLVVPCSRQVLPQKGEVYRLVDGELVLSA